MNATRTLWVFGLLFAAFQVGRCSVISETDVLLERSLTTVQSSSANIKTCRANVDLMEDLFERCADELARCHHGNEL